MHFVKIVTFITGAELHSYLDAHGLAHRISMLREAGIDTVPTLAAHSTRSIVQRFQSALPAHELQSLCVALNRAREESHDEENFVIRL